MQEKVSENSKADSLDQTKDKVIVENNAQTIFDHIKGLENDPKNKQRWIWELLQNAQDTVSDEKDDSVETEVIWDSNDLSFLHNGKAFSEEDITHLIFHGSSKKEQEGKTGKFGTGFMTTHLLSKKVRIKGNISDGRSFDFILNRSGESPKDTTITLNESWNAFKASLTTEKKEAKTNFTYLDLSPDAISTVESVLLQADILVPSVLAFAAKIKSLSIKTNIGIDVYEREKSNGGIVKIKLKKSTPIKEKYFHLLLHRLPDKKGQLALPLDEEGLITSLNEGMPRLFITFPLIGTEKAFPLPFLIHSQLFEPSTEREKLYLTAKTVETKINKEILECAFKEYLKLVNILLDENKSGNNFHFLANLGRQPDVEWLDKDWYRLQILTLIKELDQLQIIETSFTENKEKISLSQSAIPFSYNWSNENNEVKDIWNLTSKILPGMTPSEIYVDYWYKIICDRETYQGAHRNAFTLEKLCEYIEKLPNHRIEELKSNLTEPLDYISQLIHTLEKHKKEQYWNEYSILPNQLGILKKAAELKQEKIGTDEEISAIIKNISHQMGLPIRNTLLQEDIVLTSKDFQLSLETKSAVVAGLLQTVRNKKPEEQTDEWVAGNLNLLQWIFQNEKFNDLPGYPVKMLSEKWEKFQPDREPPFLCPVEIWRENFREYNELFPNDYILSSEYTFIFQDLKLLQKAIEKNWLLKDPLYSKLDEIKGKEVTLLLTRRADKEKLEKHENAEWKIEHPIKFSQLAYIDSPKDKGVIDKVRGSVKRTTQMLQFIIEVLIKEDSYGFSRFLINVNDKDVPRINVGIYPSLWMLRLKDRDWVKSLSGSTSDRPTVESLLPYFKNEKESQQLYSALLRQDVSRFLHFFGIGVGDLLRNIRSGDNEEERMEWDQSYVSILMNEKLTPQKVTSMLSDPSFIKQYEDKKELEKKVQENQEIGVAVEKAFEEALSKQSGYTLERQPIGQDYEAECDFPHPLLLKKSDNKQQSFLIEIKSARTTEIKMTITQGATACSTPEKYILCVVPINQEGINPDLIKKNARFVTNIKELLKERVNKVKSFTLLQNEAIQIVDSNSEFVRTSIEGTLVRYAIQNKVWQMNKPNALSFDEFVNGIL